MAKSCSATDCNFIPIYTDEPTDYTERLIEILDDYTEMGSDVCAEFTKMMAETRKRGVSGMACTKCGQIVRS